MKMHLEAVREPPMRRRDLHANLIEHVYADGASLARALAAAVACDLRDAILTRGVGLLAVSGGSTPRRFLSELGRLRLDWSRVVVTLVDERWVTPDDARSNARRIEALPLPFDAVVLGMGNDGHTASLFPGGDTLSQALDPQGRDRVVLLQAPGAPEARVTLTLPTLLATAALYLHIEGAEKRSVLARALDPQTRSDEMPIRAVIKCAGEPLRMYWCS